MTLRRAAPWAVSLLAHAVLVLFVPLGTDLRGMRVPAPERRVVLEFDDADRPPTDAEPSPPPAPSIGAADLALPSWVRLQPDAMPSACRAEARPASQITPSRFSVATMSPTN